MFYNVNVAINNDASVAAQTCRLMCVFVVCIEWLTHVYLWRDAHGFRHEKTSLPGLWPTKAQTSLLGKQTQVFWRRGPCEKNRRFNFDATSRKLYQCRPDSISKQSHNVETTSYQRRCDVTSHRRCYDVILTFSAYWYWFSALWEWWETR